jgi:hypothetical protein
MYVVFFWSSPRHRWSCLLLPTLKSLYGSQVGMEVKTYLHCIYCKVNTGIKEKRVILLDKDVHVCEIYMVAALILLCSLNHISLVWYLENTFAREHGLSFLFIFSLILSFFYGGHLSTHCFRYLEHLSIFSILFFLHSYMPLYCNWKTFKREIYRNLEHLFLTNIFLCLLLV